MTEIADQPPPTPNGQPAVWDLVIADMRERDQVGRERYSTPLQPFNGRDALVDAYQEALDLVVYLRQAIAERDGGTPVSSRDVLIIDDPLKGRQEADSETYRQMNIDWWREFLTAHAAHPTASSGQG
jgi:hypothetical protein